MIEVNNLQRQHRIPTQQVRQVVRRVLRRCAVQRGAVSLVFVGEQRMRWLNGRFHQRRRVTDVLAFDLRWPWQRQATFLLGDVIVAPAVAVRRAPTYRHSYRRELLTYVVHGVLHLLGYRDATPRQRQQMERLQRRILAAG